MLSSLKNYALAILALIASVAMMLMYRSKAKYEGAMRKGQEQVIETERKAFAAITKGRQREKEARGHAKTAIANRNYFS